MRCNCLERNERRRSVVEELRPRETATRLEPLDGAGGLGGDVVRDAVDALDLVRDA